jgi:hypothetical protein
MAVRFLGSVALAVSIAMLLLPQPLRAGGPRTIAGTSYFDPAVKGTPLTWSQGVVTYYTDRGNLSPRCPAPVPTRSSPVPSAGGHRFRLRLSRPFGPVSWRKT